MEASTVLDINFKTFQWLNEPKEWLIQNNILTFVTGNKTDFWQGTWYNFHQNSGHVFGVEIKGDFTISICVEADFTHLYDQAGLMIYLDEKHWLKAGIEYNDGQPMIGSVLTNQVSDWATGIYSGNPKKFYLRMTKKQDLMDDVNDVVCVKYSTDNIKWTLLRLCSMPSKNKYFVGPMACTPQREGLRVQFSGINITEPDKDILHSN